ncbi:hypothetical protein RI367_008018 [Sorochytrium milnesiophthora]
MGAGQSKASAGSGEQKEAPRMTFVNDIPVRFTEDMIAQLQRNAEHPSKRAPSSPPPPQHHQQQAARSEKPPAALSDEQINALVEQRVRERLETALQQERQRAAEREAEFERERDRRSRVKLEYESERKDSFEALHSATASRDADALLFRMDKISPPTVETNAECKRRQEAVVTCFRNNQGRSLDCWREVELYKESLKSMQRHFMETASRI